MQVIFGYIVPSGKVVAVYWEDNGRIVERSMKSDGTVTDKHPNFPDMATLHRRLSTSHYPMYAAEVGDIRSALKYLGKSRDLVELLPEIHFDVGTGPAGDTP